jgi:hypothetical protein
MDTSMNAILVSLETKHPTSAGTVTMFLMDLESKMNVVSVMETTETRTIVVSVMETTETRTIVEFVTEMEHRA